jgi:uncharacterized damage-inducible protein DinB
MSIREMLLDTFVHMPPLGALDSIAPEVAVRAPGAGLHSVAAILAHMEFWQAWFLDRCDGTALPMATAAAVGWPTVSAEGWPALVARFEAGLARAAVIGDDEARLARPVTPPIEFPPLAHYCVRDALIHVAQHNSHHLGQIITTRQFLGVWPPPSGSWTW